jgi:hypothetical protein
VKVAYNWEVSEVLRGNTDWSDFNKEAQAEFIEDVWRKGSVTFLDGHVDKGDGIFFDFAEAGRPDTGAVAEFIYNGSLDSEQPNVANSDVPTDYTDIADAAVKTLRERINIRWSKSF